MLEASRASRREGFWYYMVTIEQEAGLPVSVTEDAVMSPAGIFEFDTPKTAEEHFHSFCDLGGAKLIHTKNGKPALECGVASGLVVIQIGKGRGSFVPDLDPGRYGIGHTALGNLLSKTKRIVDVKTGTIHTIFGIVSNQWPDGLDSCTLVRPDHEGRGAINLLANGSTHPIEPTPGYRFYTPFFHHPGAGSAFTGGNVYPLYPLGIMTLDRTQLSELIRAFNKDWSNGIVFACKNRIGENLTDVNQPSMKKTRTREKKEGLDKWC